MTELPKNRFKAALAAGQQQIGLWSMLPDAYVTEIIAGCGFDWVLLDTEHSPNDLRTVTHQLQAAKGSASSIVVRVRWNDAPLIKQYLDAGAQTILVPMVNTAEEAAAAVRAVRYPPDGIRGVAAMTRASDFARIPSYAKRANAEIGLLVQVETREALDQIEAIAAVEGVDGIFIGPGDLAASLGFAGEPMHPEVTPVIEDAVKRIRTAGKPAGILTMNEDFARQAIDWGTLFTAVGADMTLLVTGANGLARRFLG
jgi:4-hydroxy-2-oxoheptanedioate aldolase